MGKSLQDQLKQAGLANAKQAAKARRSADHKRKQAQRGVVVEDEAARQVRDADAAKLERDRNLNRERQAAADARAVQAQIIQLVDLNRITDRGDREFGFADGPRIRSLHVADDDRAALVAGRLAVVRLDAAPGAEEPRYEIVPRPVAKKIAERDAERVVLMNDGGDVEVDADDPYAGYDVPDDLMW